VRIVRDNWGIAHVYGKSDADAVFGMIYAQAEDDFARIERNYLNGLGLLAQAEGETAIYSDLRQRLFIDPRRLEQEYRDAPDWLKTLMVAWSDGLNYFLSKHPAVAPAVIRHYEPWMALCFTEGSIGSDIEGIDLGKLQEFYQTQPPQPARAVSARIDTRAETAAGGSNGFAIAPGRSATGHALLWINPHTSYYFRSELQMVSEQGLNVYGAATWGQFFVYQGFNARNGWMHTSYGGDAVEMPQNIHDVTLDSLIAAGYDSHLTAFDTLLPPLFDDYDRLAADDPRRAALKEPMASLRGWDRRTSADSVPTAVAIFWGQELFERKRAEAHDSGEPLYDYLVGHLTSSERIDGLTAAVANLQRDFGQWQTPWGDINRYQRLTDDFVQPFDDAKPSLPVGLAASKWGALASFDTETPGKTKKIYGSVGNSFVAAVEFGPAIHAKAILSGGESGDPHSPHFADQAQMFVQGRFRDVLFSPEDVMAHAERSYHP
jgi:acyl-homoserine lactone acylase PvdQ